MSGISKVGIVGAGTMGRRIAFGCAIRSLETRLFDIDPDATAKALGVVRGLVEERVASGRLPPGSVDAAMNRLSGSASLADCVAGANLVIETVSEELELKRRVFSQIDSLAPPESLIGTNSSSIPGSWIADATRRPAKVFNLNFGPPDHVKVELMGHPGTAPETIEAALEFVRSLGLVPIHVKKEILGYATNRIWRAIKKETLFLLDGGYITAEDIDRAWMLDWHTSIGPCGLMDVVGLDVVRDIEMIYYRASGDPSDRPPKLLEEMVAQGKLGVKSGRGFYTY